LTLLDDPGQRKPVEDWPMPAHRGRVVADGWTDSGDGGGSTGNGRTGGATARWDA
jgi:hypothetical protein